MNMQIISAVIGKLSTGVPLCVDIKNISLMFYKCKNERKNFDSQFSLLTRHFKGFFYHCIKFIQLIKSPIHIWL